MLMKSAVVVLAALVCLSGCASMSKTEGFHPGLTRDEVDNQLGSPDSSHIGEFSGKETRVYRLYRSGTAVQIVGGFFTMGLIPFVMPGKANYYTLFDKEGKLLAYGPSSYHVASQSFIGLNAKDLYKGWGVPQQQQTTPDGGTAYVYLANVGSITNTDFSGNAQTTYQRGGRGTASTDFDGSGVSSSYLTYCRTTFIADKSGLITRALTEGNRCNY